MKNQNVIDVMISFGSSDNGGDIPVRMETFIWIMLIQNVVVINRH